MRQPFGNLGALSRPGVVDDRYRQPPAAEATPTSSPPLDVVLSVILDADGDAQASIGPAQRDGQWVVHTISLQGTSTVQPIVNVHHPSSTHAVAATSNGNHDTAQDDPPIQLAPGEAITITWMGGTPGARQSARLSGRRELS